MSKPTDQDRILKLLANTEGLSNLRIKTELNLSDTRYSTVRDNLIKDDLVEKYVCGGGGIRLSRKGESQSPVPDENQSTVNREADLYAPLIQFLEEQAAEDEIPVVICPTYMLKARGQWQNPDITKITIERYKHIRKTHVMVTTYEVKQFGKWNVGAVYEAASHHRVSHEAYVVLEWPKPLEFSLTDPTYKLDQIGVSKTRSRSCDHGAALRWISAQRQARSCSHHTYRRRCGRLA